VNHRRQRLGLPLKPSHSNYATGDARRIKGLHTQKARQTIGSAHYDEVVHRGNLVLIV
jgi:glutamate 5-kinase